MFFSGLELPLPVGGARSHLTRGFFVLREPVLPNGIEIGSAVFA